MKILAFLFCVLMTVTISSSWKWPEEVNRDYPTRRTYPTRAPTTTSTRSEPIWGTAKKYGSNRRTISSPITSMRTTSSAVKESISKIKCREYTALAYEKIYNGKKYLTSMKKCNDGRPLIVQGAPAKNREFPHMAALGWKNSILAFKCGGSLISERFVLTAAHCRDHGTPDFVRLGSTSNVRNVTGQAVEIDVQTFTTHPDYKYLSKFNDIALIKLDQDVTFNDFIRPACLHQLSSISGNVVATGWGRTSSNGEVSKDLLKVKLRVNKYMNKCQDVDKKDIDKARKQICVGGDDKRDSCYGDSGGPIQVHHSDIRCVYDIVGVTSYGPRLCGSKSPAVYTRVSSYIDWIEGTAWGQN